MPPEPTRQAGQGLIAAVFVIVVLAMLGTALVRIFTTEERASGREMASTYAFYAGESVVQWTLYQALVRDDTSLADAEPLTSPRGGLRACEESRVKGAVEPFGTVPVPGGQRDLFRFETVGTCFPGTPELTRRAKEVRFSK